MPEKPPLKTLKAELVKYLQLDQAHYFTVFAKYNFWNSYRRSLKMCQKNYREQDAIEEAKFAGEQRIGITDGLQDFQTKKGHQPTPMEDNMLLVSWLDGTRSSQNENDVSDQDRLIRYLNLGETLVLYE